jgi:hypothetical protein
LRFDIYRERDLGLRNFHQEMEGKEGRKEGRKKRKIRLKLYATHPIPLHLAQTTDSL